MRILLTLVSLITLPLAATAGEPNVDTSGLVARYVEATQTQRVSSDSAPLEVDIRAAVPKLHKIGRLLALRKISNLGRITYDKVRFEGDGTVRNQVIARYLKAEAEARQKGSDNLAVTPENYKFKYQGEREWLGRPVHVFELTPRRKAVGLYKGQLWIDSSTNLPIREFGVFVKNPSVFLKKVEFVREYDIRDGRAVTTMLRSAVHTRVVGTAHISIAYIDPNAPETSTAALLMDSDGSE